MKKLLSIIIVVILVVSLAACGEKPSNNTDHTVDIEYYAKLGQFSDIGYKLGDDVDSIKQALSSNLNEEGEPNFFEHTHGKYTIMTDGLVYCCYETDNKKAGITHLAKSDSIYGFATGDISTQVREVMSDLGYDAKEREAKDDELFFMPGSNFEGSYFTVLEYKIKDNTLLFAFNDNALCAAVVYK